MLETALTLGTPLVTTAAEATDSACRQGSDVEVAEHGLGARTGVALAAAIAADDGMGGPPARRGAAVRRAQLDLDRIAALVIDRLGLAPPEVERAGSPRARLDQRLDELVTPPDAVIRDRADTATACFAPSGLPSVVRAGRRPRAARVRSGLRRVRARLRRPTTANSTQ